MPTSEIEVGGDNFEEWLKSMQAPQGLIDKMKQAELNMLSLLCVVYSKIQLIYVLFATIPNKREMLQQLDVNNKKDIDDSMRDLKLTAIEKLKFKVILKKIPKENQSLDVCRL